MLTWLRRLIDRVAQWPVLVAWLALIFGLSSIPNEIQGPTGGVPYDKIAHFGEYGVLSFLVAWIVSRARGERRVGMAAAAIGVAAAVLYGVSDEWHQSFVPGRDPSWDDLATDAVGAVAGAVAAWVVSRAGRRGAHGDA
jgi:VanZ family protein